MYQALYRKYRPQTFDDVVGQNGVTQTLKNQLVNGRLSHAYLFTGTRGTGKTSCAKILAKAVNCEHPEDGNPCNHCAACRSIDAGTCMDVLEIDAASNNGVDNVRALRDEAVYTPAQVKKRVYIIDEVHMLSMSAFNALLKIIEEPPEHLLFILATTELHKVPATILSRCQRFAFRRLLAEDISDRLNHIAFREHIDLEPDAASFLARLADGGMRDAVSLLDQCASAADGAVTTEQVCRVLGLAGTRNTVQLLQAIAAQDSVRALKIFNEQYADGKDLSAMLDELCGAARDLLILHTAPKSGINLISGICTETELQTLLPLFSAGELLRMTAVLQEATAGFRGSTNRRIDAELCILRLCEPAAALDAQSLNARISRLEGKLASGAFVAQPVRTPAASEPEEERPPWDDDDIPPESSAPQPITPPAPTGFWAELVSQMRTQLKPPEMGMFSTAESAPLRGSLEGDRLVLTATTDFVYQIINKPNILQTIAEKASAIVGRRITVKMTRQGEQPKNSASFERLIGFGTEHTDIIDMK